MLADAITYPGDVKQVVESQMHAVEALMQQVKQTAYLTRSAVSRLLGVSPNTVSRWAREGRLPCQVTLGGHHRFDREFVEQLRKSLSRAGGQTS
jgi:excisionase family DNA binding protein